MSITKKTETTGKYRSGATTPTRTTTTVMIHPESIRGHDVLAGRGGMAIKHVGNQRFRRLVNENRLVYQRCDKHSHKLYLTVSIIEAIKNRGGRFLKKDETKDVWLELPRKEAIAKTAQALREKEKGGGGDTESGKGAEPVERLLERKRKKEQERLENEMKRLRGGSSTASPDKVIPVYPSSPDHSPTTEEQRKMSSGDFGDRTNILNNKKTTFHTDKSQSKQSQHSYHQSSFKKSNGMFLGNQRIVGTAHVGVRISNFARKGTIRSTTTFIGGPQTGIRTTTTTATRTERSRNPFLAQTRPSLSSSSSIPQTDVLDKDALKAIAAL